MVYEWLMDFLEAENISFERINRQDLIITPWQWLFNLSIQQEVVGCEIEWLCCAVIVEPVLEDRGVLLRGDAEVSLEDPVEWVVHKVSFAEVNIESEFEEASACFLVELIFEESVRW